MTEAKAKLSKIVHNSEIVAISYCGKVAGFYVPRGRFEALFETMEVLANPEALKTLKAAKAGKIKYRALSHVEKELGLD